MDNPCETCKKICPYRLFIDCPDWLSWAEEQNDVDEEAANGD